MAISPNHDVVMGGGLKLALRNLREVLPCRYTHRTPYELGKKLQDRFQTQSRELESSNRKIADLENMVQELRLELRSSNTKIANLENMVQELYSERKSSNSKRANRKKTAQQPRSDPTTSRERTDNPNRILRAYEWKCRCETLYTQGHINDAARLFLEISSSMNNTVRSSEGIAGWLSEFALKCAVTLEENGDTAEKTNHHDEALAAYTTALALSPSTPNSLLSKWAKMVLLSDSVDEAMVDAAAFNIPMFSVSQAICDALEGDGRVGDAIKCHQQTRQKIIGDTSKQNEQAQWELDFRQRCRLQLEKLGGNAMANRKYREADEHFSTILSLDPVNRVEILIKRSKIRISMRSWEDALRDADEVVKLDPSSHRGYEQRHEALHAVGKYAEAVDAFHTMLSKLEESPHAHIRGLRTQYIDVSSAIRKAVEKIVSDAPRVLIDTTTGRLHDKAQQMAAFKNFPIYNELRSSMTTRRSLNNSRIQDEVKKHYRYVMLSHRWEHGEPLFQIVQNISVYELEPSSPNTKLQKFCRVACGFGFHWAWSDTCCIDRKDMVVLHEALIAMFTWYRGSALTLVHLRGIPSQSQKPGDLRESEWNERGWTYQEYVAARTVQFHTEDWKPYLGLDVFNHKESPAIVAEMSVAEVSTVSARRPVILQPGLSGVREKLFLASQRQTTLAEDTAYALFGIFNAAIPIRYGEGKCMAVGRLLEHILTSSGNVTILAWTGPAGDYNSCLPPDLTVYDQLIPLHIPSPATMGFSQQSSFQGPDPPLPVVKQLYHQLNGLPSPSLNSSRLKLPGLAFRVNQLDELKSEGDLRVYRAATSVLGDVEIKTKDDLSGMTRLRLFHPWISTLLDSDFSPNMGSPMTYDGLAWCLFRRLMQPFGALLLTRVDRVQYRRVATDSLIMVQIRQDTPLTDLIDSISTVDVQ